jgi:hypothetical protein
MKSDSGEFRQDGKVWGEMIKFMHTANLVKSTPEGGKAFSNDYLP